MVYRGQVSKRRALAGVLWSRVECGGVEHKTSTEDRRNGPWSMREPLHASALIPGNPIQKCSHKSVALVLKIRVRDTVCLVSHPHKSDKTHVNSIGSVLQWDITAFGHPLCSLFKATFT